MSETQNQQPIRLTADSPFIVLRPDGTVYVPRIPPGDPFALIEASRAPEYDYSDYSSKEGKS